MINNLSATKKTDYSDTEFYFSAPPPPPHHAPYSDHFGCPGWLEETFSHNNATTVW